MSNIPVDLRIDEKKDTKSLIISGKEVLSIRNNNGDFIVSPFEKVPYIESTNEAHGAVTPTEYIDTGFRPAGASLVVECVAQYTQINVSYQLNGIFATKHMDWGIDSTNKFCANTNAGSSSKANDTARHTFIYSASGGTSTLKVDGTEVSTGANYGTPSANNYILFARGQASNVQYPSTMRLFSCKITYNGSVVRDFIPVRLTKDIPATLDSQGVARQIDTIGLLDKIEGKFYANKGTGKFKTCYIRQEYITTQATAGTTAAIINTDFKPESDSKLYVDGILQFTASPTNSQMGAFTAGSQGGTDLYDIGGGTVGIIYSNPYGTYRWSTGKKTTERNQMTWDYVNKKVSCQTAGTNMLATFTDYSKSNFFIGARSSGTTTTALNYGQGGSQRVYEFKAWKGSTMQKCLIPVKLTTNLTSEFLGGQTSTSTAVYGACGMWDIISNKFYGNVGSSSCKIDGGDSRYTICNYITSSGTQCLVCKGSSLISGKSSWEISCKYDSVVDSFQGIIETGTSAPRCDFGIYGTSVTKKFYCSTKEGSLKYSINEADVNLHTHKIDTVAQTYTLDGVLQTNLGGNTIPAYSQCLFARSQVSGGTVIAYSYCKVSIYDYKQYNNGVLELHLIPCKLNKTLSASEVGNGATGTNIQSGAYGMWDMISNKFYGNNGSGSFTGA